MTEATDRGAKSLPASHAQSQMKGNGWQIRQQQAACRTGSALPRSTGTTKYWRVCMQLLHQSWAFPEFLASMDKDSWTFSDVTVKGNNRALNYLCCGHIWTSWLTLWRKQSPSPSQSGSLIKDLPLSRLYLQSGQVILLQGNIQHSDPLNLLSQNRLSSSWNLQMEQDLQGLCGWQRKIVASVSWDPLLHLHFTAAQ